MALKTSVNTGKARITVRTENPFAHSEASGAVEAMGRPARLRFESDDFPLASGWCWVELELQQLGDDPIWVFFYPDYGWGSYEGLAIFLPFVTAGKQRHAGVVRFAHDVRSMQFDSIGVGNKFHVGSVELKRLGKPAAAVKMLSSLLLGNKSLAAKTRLLAALGKQLLTEGMSAFAEHLYECYAELPWKQTSYGVWLKHYDLCGPGWTAQAKVELGQFRQQPLFSIIMPVYNTPVQWLRRCIASVQAQLYTHWELCIADDASTEPAVKEVLEELSAADARIKLVWREQNGHISAASNSALEIASGDWIVLLDHDDELHPFALHEVAKAIDRHPDWRLIYSDEDKLDAEGQRYDPYMKPDWNYDLFLSHNCFSHLGIYCTDLVREVGGFRVGLEGSQDWDLALRCVERVRTDQIGHIPHVLYHWRAIPGSTALGPEAKTYTHDSGLRAVREHLKRISARAVVQELQGLPGHFRVRYALSEPVPRVSIIIPTRDQVELLKACVHSLLEKTQYPDIEILIVDNQSIEAETLDYFVEVCRDPRVRVLAFDAPFNYSAINNYAAEAATGSVLCLLNNDITVIGPDWLEEMVGHACREGIGAVGAMLYYPDDTIQHAGVILGINGVATHAFVGRPRGFRGYMGRSCLTQQMSAVTAACLVVRKEVFDSVRGFDSRLEVTLNDVDFCLRLLEHGYRNVWTPYAELYHHESASRGAENTPEKQARFQKELGYMRMRWGDLLDHDPAYSLNYTISGEPYELAYPPRSG